MNDKEYFSRAALSKSQLKQWDRRNPKKFWDNCAFNPNKVTEWDSDYTARGDLSHMLLFRRDLVKENFVVMDGLGKSRSTIKWSEAQAKEKRTIISSEELADATKRTEALFKQEMILNLLKYGKCEAPFFWHDKEWDIDCKMRTDYETGSGEGIYCIDLKTTAKEFPQYIDKGDYQYEIGTYARGLRVKYGQPIKKFIYIFQSTKKNEEHNIRVKVVEGAQLEACEIFTSKAVMEIVPRIRAWQDEMTKAPQYRNGEKVWLPEVVAENWEISPWFERNMIEKGEN